MIWGIHYFTTKLKTKMDVIPRGCFNNQSNPLPAKLFYLNFHPLEVVSRYRDPQLQVDENYS